MTLGEDADFTDPARAASKDMSSRTLPIAASLPPQRPAGRARETSMDVAPDLHDEARLVRGVLAGDGEAFARLVRPHLPMLLRVGHRATRDRALGEDAVQEALTIAAREMGQYQVGTSIRAWLASIVATRGFTLVRSEARRRSRDERSEAPGHALSPHDVIQGRQTAARIDAILAEMPEKRRLAAMLRLDAGMDYAEIATAVGSTEESARALVYLAVKTLRRELRDEEVRP